MGHRAATRADHDEVGAALVGVQRSGPAGPRPRPPARSPPGRSTSLLSAYLAGVDRATICEVPFDIELLAGYLLEDKASNPPNYAMVTIS